MNNIFEAKGDYVIINDYTTDVDDINDIKIIENKGVDEDKPGKCKNGKEDDKNNGKVKYRSK